jgi:hypothetical protein
VAAAGAALLVAIVGSVVAFRMLQEPAPSHPSQTAEAQASPAAVTPAPSVRLAGEWRAEVAYEWGDKYTERFTFTLDGNDVLGTASFLGVRRGILEGTLDGDRVQFRTRTQEVLGDWNKPKDVVHRYRGRISGDTITFFMQSEGGVSSLPVEFTATRVPEGTPEAGSDRR